MTIVGVVQGLGMGLPDLKSKKKGKQNVSKEPHQQVVETLDKLREKTRETIKELESMIASTPEFGNEPLIEDWVKQFEELACSQVFSFVYFPQFLDIRVNGFLLILCIFVIYCLIIYFCGSSNLNCKVCISIGIGLRLSYSSQFLGV